MKKEIRADYQSQMVLPPSLEDWIGEDHPARFIRDFVDSLDLAGLGFKQRKSEDGRPSYAPDLLLKVWLYGYFDRIRSTRSLERACRDSIALIWLTGMNYPDHNTLWRFLKNNRRPIRKVFAQGVRVAAKADLIGMVLHAVDGTKIRARGSKWTAHHRKTLEESLNKLDQKIDEMLAEVEASEENEIGEYRLSEELADAEERKELIRKALKELDEAGTDHLQPSEPDARMMKCQEAVDFAYNAQAVVDEQSGLIVAQDVTTDETDHAQLPKMLDTVKEMTGSTAETTVADAGYASGDTLTKAHEMRAEVLVSLPGSMAPPAGKGEYHTSRFSYDPEADVCICPRGERLRFQREKWATKRRYKVRVYHCKQYRECPVRWQCSKNKRGRVVEIGPHHEAVKRQIDKQQEPENQAMLKKRKAIVEPVFGNVKEGMGFRRWHLWYITGVKTQWAMVCLTANLRKLFRHWAVGELQFQ
jgi:transposase